MRVSEFDDAPHRTVLCVRSQFAPLMINRLVPVPSPSGAYACSEPNVSVRDTSAWALGKVALFQLTQLDDATVVLLVDVMCACLKDEPRVVVNATYVRDGCSGTCWFVRAACFVCAFVNGTRAPTRVMFTHGVGVWVQCLNVLSSGLADEERHNILSSRLQQIIKCLGDAQARCVRVCNRVHSSRFTLFRVTPCTCKAYVCVCFPVGQQCQLY